MALSRTSRLNAKVTDGAVEAAIDVPADGSFTPTASSLLVVVVAAMARTATLGADVMRLRPELSYLTAA